MRAQKQKPVGKILPQCQRPFLKFFKLFFSQFDIIKSSFQENQGEKVGKKVAWHSDLTCSEINCTFLTLNDLIYHDKKLDTLRLLRTFSFFPLT